MITLGEGAAALAGGKGASGAAALAKGEAQGTASFKEGSFSITDWTGYPNNLPKPNGPFRLLEGAEYQAAREAANKANSSLRSAHPNDYSGKQIHEIHPVKFGGSPTEPGNKIALPLHEHAVLTTFWNRFMRDMR